MQSGEYLGFLVGFESHGLLLSFLVEAAALLPWVGWDPFCVLGFAI